MPDRVLPAFVRRPVVWIVLGDIAVDAGQRELFILSAGYRLYDQLRVRKRRFALVLIAAARDVTFIYHHWGDL